MSYAIERSYGGESILLGDGRSIFIEYAKGTNTVLIDQILGCLKNVKDSKEIDGLIEAYETELNRMKRMDCAERLLMYKKSQLEKEHERELNKIKQQQELLIDFPPSLIDSEFVDMFSRMYEHRIELQQTFMEKWNQINREYEDSLIRIYSEYSLGGSDMLLQVEYEDSEEEFEEEDYDY